METETGRNVHAQLTAALAENARLGEQLRQARTAAEFSDQTRTLFLATLSQDVRAPLNSIIGMLELCLRTDLQPTQRGYLDRARQAAGALLRSVDDALDYPHDAQNGSALQRVRFSLGQVFDEVTRRFATTLVERHLGLIYDIDPAIERTLIGDPRRLGQILNTLVGNAIRFSTHGDIVITARLDAPVPTSRSVVAKTAGGVVEHAIHFSVSDQGVGLTPEHHAQLSAVFGRKVGEGLDIHGGDCGLSICQRLVAMMGGTIWVETAYGVGSTFHFTCCLSAVCSDGVAALAAALAPWSRRPVLIVNANQQAARLLARDCACLGLRSVQLDVLALGADATPSPDGYCLGLIDCSGLELTESAFERWYRCLAGAQAGTPLPLLKALAPGEAVDGVEIGAPFRGGYRTPVRLETLYADLARTLGLPPVTEAQDLGRRTSDTMVSEQLPCADILVVEDTELSQELMRELLGAAGLRVRVAANGAEALCEISRSRPDLVLMDCQMPVMDGFEATRQLRADARYADLPIIAVTATDDGQTRYRDAGMNAQLTKPVDTPMLFALLRQYLNPELSTCMATVPAPTSESLPSAPSALDAMPGESKESAQGLAEQVSTDGLDKPGLLCLPGVNEAIGLGYLGGDLALFVRLLCKFEQQQGGRFEEEFSRALAAGDWREAIRIVHSLKSVARTLGIGGLGERAVRLEEAARDQARERIAILLPDTLAELERVRAGIRGLDG